ncbi:MAG: TlpA disulfide reductase family protein [Verrucomicrobiota bacterium]
MRHALSILFTSLLLMSLAGAAVAEENLIGTKAAPWNVTNWFNSAPIELESLKGKVVLVRWWTAPDCPYCKATAPSLNEFHKDYSNRGLQVIGFYHHKSDEPLRKADVKRFAMNFGFQFPVATDTDWKTLHRWWLDRGHSEWTSVSFLIDRMGIIRHIHPGGEYVKGDKDFAQMKAKIEELLAEK